MTSPRRSHRGALFCLLSLGLLLSSVAGAGCHKPGGSDDSPPLIITDDTTGDEKLDSGRPSADVRSPVDSGEGRGEAETGTSADVQNLEDATIVDSRSPRPDVGESPEECTGSKRWCNGRCVELLSNPDNCGSCGSPCGDGQSCVNGICRCGAKRVMCDGECVDTRYNDNHCFQCGHACPAGNTYEDKVSFEVDMKDSGVKYTNQARQTPTDCGQYGVKPAGPPVTVNPELEKAAQAYAEKMAKHGFLSHTDPIDGSSFVVRINRTNYSGQPVGENLSRAVRASAKRIVNGWVSSDSHCRNLANPNATEIGVGVADTQSGKFDSYWVQLFGRR